MLKKSYFQDDEHKDSFKNYNKLDRICKRVLKVKMELQCVKHKPETNLTWYE